MAGAWDDIIYELNGRWVIASHSQDRWWSNDGKYPGNVYTADTLEELAKQIRQYPTKERAVAKARTRYPVGSRAYIHMLNQY